MGTITATYAGQTAGTGATVANSDDFGDSAMETVSPGTGGTIVYNTTNARSGNGLVYTQATAAQQAFVRYQVDPADFSSLAFRFYIALTGLPGTDANFPCRVMTSAGAGMFQILCRTTGVLRIANTAGTVVTSTTAVLTGDAQVYRIECQASGLGTATASISLQMFVGDSTTAMTGGSIGPSTVDTGLTAARLLTLGKTSSAVLNSWTIDDVKATSGTTTPIGPAAATSVWSLGRYVDIG